MVSVWQLQVAQLVQIGSSSRCNWSKPVLFFGAHQPFLNVLLNKVEQKRIVLILRLFYILFFHKKKKKAPGIRIIIIRQ